MLEEAARFHGHLGPYLALGLKMGLLAQELLQGDPFSVSAQIHTDTSPPRSCMVDGIQFSSGCTLGKGNITIKEDSQLFGIFNRDSCSITIRVRPEIVDSLTSLSREHLEGSARSLFKKKNEDLFEVVQ
ncbi:MAG: formylmethanofuran dehydrogenase [Theionarchaea archaeon]|nr:formylmethanofuran dehydrogenase [Theionarchaea archaeon]